MRTIHLNPSDKIASYVHRILIIEDFKVRNPFLLPLYANGSPTLLFQTVKGKIQNSSNYLTLFGQTVAPEILQLEEDFTLIAYFFKPHALKSLFGVPAQELTDRPIDLNVLQPKKTRELQEKLLNAECTSERVELLDNYIHSLMLQVNDDLRFIQHASSMILANQDKKILTNLQHELFLTERTFQRLFVKHIGIAPNQFRRIAQFNSAFLRLQFRNYSSLSDIAFEHGYADQSHYIRSFKEFTGITPTDYLSFGTLSNE